MYMLALCTYSVMKIKKRTMTDQNFTRNMERFIHPTILLFTMSLSIAGLVTRTINGTSLGNICTFAAVPAGCRQVDFLECDPSVAQNSKILSYISVIGLEFSCLLGIVVCMSALCLHILNTVKIASHRGRGGGGGGASPHYSSLRRLHISSQHVSSSDAATSTLESDGTNSSSPRQASAGDDNQELSSSADNNDSPDEVVRIYRNEIVLQACWFVLVYFMTFICRWIVYIYLLNESRPPYIYIRVSSVLYPLGGFLNVFVYTRPKVTAFRIQNPDYSLMRSFWLVIKNGNNAPAIDRRGTNNDRLVIPAELRSIVLFHCPSLVSSGVGAIYNGSESIEEVNLAYRSKADWQHTNLGRQSGLGVIEEQDEDEERQSSSSMPPFDISNFSRPQSAPVDEEESKDDENSTFLSPVDGAIARAMGRIQALDHKRVNK